MARPRLPDRTLMAIRRQCEAKITFGTPTMTDLACIAGALALFALAALYARACGDL